jgi:hypothetical protein
VTVRILERLRKDKRWLLAVPLLLAIWSLFVEPARLVRRHVERTWTQAPVRIVFFSDLRQGCVYLSTLLPALLLFVACGSGTTRSSSNTGDGGTSSSMDDFT